MRSIYIFLIIFITNFAYAEIHIYATINGNDKTVCKIKNNLFIDGETNTLKIN